MTVHSPLTDDEIADVAHATERIAAWSSRFGKNDNPMNQEAMSMYLAAVSIVRDDVPRVLAELRAARHAQPPTQ